jgi:beta-ureidopropionase / N-carbamoyl-L-amino-acid hydrolase
MSEGTRFVRWFDELAAIGRLPEGRGWRRFAWTAEDREARSWFSQTTESLGLSVETDGNGNMWAWWGARGPDAVVTGSHLDTVAAGGAYDGALGVVSALAAVDALQRSHGGPPPRPVAVVAFTEEEGGRYNLPCFGSRMLTGALTPDLVRDRVDADGIRLAEAMESFGSDPDGLGPDPERLARIGTLVEVHVEQGRGLVDLDTPIAVATGVWTHGRWRLTLTGEANHAGTTRLVDRRDPVLVAAGAARAARSLAEKAGMVATIGRLIVEPNSPNTVAARVTASLDARAPDPGALDGFVEAWASAVRAEAADHGVAVDLSCDSRTTGVAFDPEVRRRIEEVLARICVSRADLPTAAGHDAGVLAELVPAAMIFVRNPTGASHTPAEHASVEDCLTGVEALTAVVEDLAWPR